MAMTNAERQAKHRDKLRGEGKRQMLITLAADDWRAGYDAGARREKMASDAALRAAGIDPLSWLSGYIEGKAKEQVRGDSESQS